MKRPLMVRLLPDVLKTRAAQRFYSEAASTWRPLYDAAPLRFAPHVTMSLLPGDIISDPIAFTGIWRLSSTRRLHELAKRGGLLVDVGANLGYFSLLWAGLRPDNRVVSIEASPRNVELLRRNVTQNGFDARMTVLGCAAGRAAGTLMFDAGPAAQTGWGSVASEIRPTTISVKTVRVDEVVDPGTEIALMKIDTQGSDAWVLEGCESLLRARRVREVWFEENRPRMAALGISPTATLKYLDALGYTSRPERGTSGDLVQWRATPR